MYSLYTAFKVSNSFQFLENDFLKYLDDWEASAMAREGFTDEERKKMILSRETLDGLHMTSKL